MIERTRLLFFSSFTFPRDKPRAPGRTAQRDNLRVWTGLAALKPTRRRPRRRFLIRQGETGGFPADAADMATVKGGTQRWDDASLLRRVSRAITRSSARRLRRSSGVSDYAGLRSTRCTGARRSWEETRAQIDDIDLHSVHDRDSTTHKVVAPYTYKFAGRHYTGERVGLSGLADNIGGWQIGTFQRLREAKGDGRPVVCYVDPDDRRARCCPANSGSASSRSPSSAASASRSPASRASPRPVSCSLVGGCH